MNEKLSPRFYGPFKVLEKIGVVAYKLLLPETSRLHLVFHVSQLKRAHPTNQPSQILPPFLTEERVLQAEAEEVRAIRPLLNGSWEVLIKWAGLPEKDKTWEYFELLQTAFPHFHLEDKVQLIGGSIDGPGQKGPPLKTYQLRKGKIGNAGMKTVKHGLNKLHTCLETGEEKDTGI